MGGLGEKPVYHNVSFIAILSSLLLSYQVRQKVIPKIICCFLSHHLEFQCEIL